MFAWAFACAWHVPRPEGAAEALRLVPRSGENRPFIEIDGRIWLLDTGYSRTTCDDALVTELGERTTAGGAAHGEVGVVKVGRAVLDDVEIGGWAFRRLPCAVRDLQTTSSVGQGVVGVLGSNVLRHFRVELHFDEGAVWLDRGDMTRPEAAARLQPEAGFGNRRTAWLEVDGTRVPVVVDTGADRTYLPLHQGEEIARYTGIRQGTGPQGEVELEVVFRKVESARIDELALPVASYVERPRKPCFPGGPAWLPEAWTQGECPMTSDRGRAGLLGMDALGGRRLYVDYRERWLWRE